MQLKILLNRVQRHKGFVYGNAQLEEEDKDIRLLVDVRPRKGSRPACSGCKRPRTQYDTLPQRRFQFVPLWGIAVFFLYRMRRVDCPACGVKVEVVPWAEGKSPITTTYAWFLARWGKRMSWQEVAVAFHTNWDTVFRAVSLAVQWGLKHRDLKGIRAIGVDEVLWHRGKYLTVVYQIDNHCRRLLWLGEDRTKACLEDFFKWFGLRARWLKFICSDMWRPYLDVIALRTKTAIHVLDQFHIVSNINKAIDEIRAGEARRMKADGYEPILKHSRWCLLKRPENLTDKQSLKLSELVQYNLRSVRAYLLKEELQLLWQYASPSWAGKFLDKWCARVMRSRLEPLKREARALRRCRELILNWFRAKGTISAGPVEGMNNKLKVITRRAYGFRTFKAASVALYHSLGALPEPEMTHEFF